MTSANQMKADLRRLFDDGWTLDCAMRRIGMSREQMPPQDRAIACWLRSLWARWEDESALALVQAVMAG